MACTIETKSLYTVNHGEGFPICRYRFSKQLEVPGYIALYIHVYVESNSLLTSIVSVNKPLN